MNKKGFTLVELLAVIVVLAIVMIVVADRVGDAMLKSRGNSLALQVKSLNREVEKVGAMENQITTKQIDKIVSSGDLKYLGYVKAGTGNFNNDVIVVQAQKGSKFANIAFTNDMDELGTYVYKKNGNSITLGNNTVKNSKAWLREPIIYFETTVPIDDTTAVDGITNFTIVNPATDIPKDGNGTEGGEQPVKTYAVGDEVCLNGNKDCFNVIKDNGDSVTMLAKYNLTLDGLTQTISTDSNVYGLKFAEQNPNKKPNNQYGYWTDDNGELLPEYGTDSINQYGSYEKLINVYNSKSNTYKVVEAYVEKLKGIKFINNDTSLTGRLLYRDEYFNLYNIQENREWLKNGQDWWTGTADDYNSLRYTDCSGYLSNSDFWGNRIGVRPVITVLKSKI